eukprot:jgi/Hompol1/2717/HPOL_006142-RA
MASTQSRKKHPQTAARSLSLSSAPPSLSTTSTTSTAVVPPSTDASHSELELLLAGLKALEAKTAECDALAKQIHQQEQVCLKDLAKQRAAVRSFLANQDKLRQQTTSANAASAIAGEQHSSVNGNTAGSTSSTDTPISKQDADSLLRKLQDIEYQFPQPPGLMLKLALGNSAPVALRPLKLRIDYKRDYELFKLGTTVASLVICAICLFVVTSSRVVDALYEFLMLYYYCTITLREHVLLVNGSRMRKWWLTHHYLSIITSGVVL